MRRTNFENQWVYDDLNSVRMENDLLKKKIKEQQEYIQKLELAVEDGFFKILFFGENDNY